MKQENKTRDPKQMKLTRRPNWKRSNSKKKRTCSFCNKIIFTKEGTQRVRKKTLGKRICSVCRRPRKTKAK